MMGSNWATKDKHYKIVHARNETSRVRMEQIKEALAAVEQIPVKYICISCQENEQADRKQHRFCNPCSKLKKGDRK